MKLIHKAYQTIVSTQDVIKEFSHEIEPDTLLLCTAEEQTKGRGTKNRRWVSPPEVNIYATYGFLFPSWLINDLPLIPQVAAYSVFLTLQELKFNNISVKWVNDVLLDNKKICGILSESTQAKSQDGYIVYLGIGLNVNMDKSVCDSLDQPVTSLKASTGRSYDKNEILSCLNKHLDRNISLLKSSGFQDFYRKISDVMAFKHERIFFDTENASCQPRAFYAKVIGIDARGALILEPELSAKQLDSIRVMMGLKTESLGSKQLYCITGRILRGKEIIDYQDSMRVSKSDQPTKACHAHKWKIMGGTAALLATYGLYCYFSGSRPSSTAQLPPHPSL